MSDPLARTELPHEPFLGLRRRHRAGLVFRHNNAEDADGADDADTDDRDANTPQNNDNEDNDDNLSITPGGQPSSTTNSGRVGIGIFRISRLYCFLSIVSALAAVVLAPVPTHKIEYHDLATMLYEATEGNGSMKSPRMDTENENGRLMGKTDVNLDLKTWSLEEFVTHAFFLGVSASQNRGIESPTVGESTNDADNKGKKGGGNEQRKRRRRPAVLVDDLPVDSNEKTNSLESSPAKKSLFTSIPSKASTSPGNENRNDDNSRAPAARIRNWMERMNRLVENSVVEVLQRRKEKLDGHSDRERKMDRDTIEHTRNLVDEKWQWIDPIFLESRSFLFVFTNVVDKILKSTIRLCIITNFLLTMTYILHSAVAAWFLSNSGSSEASNNSPTIQRPRETNLEEDPARMVSEWSFASPSGANGARERMGGFLVFKLLLISAVLAPDTLDLMILFTWFTLLGCLRSLDHLAHSTNVHLAATGQAPKKGIVQLLFWVLACDIVAAGSCVALFHTAGWGMVLLLICDCALLGTDAVSHVLKYYQSVLENSHDNDIRGLEERQLNLHRLHEDDASYEHSVHEDEREQAIPGTVTMTLTEIRQESGRLDQQMEGLELAHSRRLSIFETAIFCLDMTCHIFTISHFCHIWTLHGVQFTLIDGVLALHLHSAISTACAKLARRRNIYKIARDLEGHFPDATDEELKQASADGDVCCICLGSMTKGGNVKKVSCGHIYHTHCLREVIERAQNLQSAKCPLCRSPLVGCYHSIGDPPRRDDNHNNNFVRQRNTTVGTHVPAVQGTNNAIDTGIDGDGGGDIVPGRQVEGERALFRFSTEEILPLWLPVPAFSFEVVRRPPLGAQRQAQPQNEQVPTAPSLSTQRIDPVALLSSDEGEGREFRIENEIQAEPLQQQQQPEDTRISFVQRMLLFTGLMPMSPEEEARALEQLVDMFPQYDRSDLSRELRNRGSLEAVTEAILIGIFSGVPRGE